MRALILGLLGLVSSVSWAQAPDPTPAERYYPLGVGDVWEYALESFGQTPTLQRVTIERDSVVDGVRYAVQATAAYGDGASAPPTSVTRILVRFDAASGRVAYPVTAGAQLYLTCRLDAPFGAALDCNDWSSSDGGPEETQSDGGLGGTVMLGDIEVAVEARKSFVAGFGDGGTDLYAAPIGFISNTGAFCEGCSTQLRYARVGGVVYGRPFTSSESAPAADVRVSVSPNPARDRVTVALPHDAVRVSVADLLGREVLAWDARLGAEARIDVSAWPAGVYVVRVDGRAPVRFTVAR